MKSSNRLLVTFGIVIGVLVVTGIVLGLTLGGQTASLLPEDTPEGTVQRYILAIKAEDYEKAYGYLSPAALAESTYFDTYEKWSQRYSRYRESRGWKATLGESTVTGDEATVEVTIDVFRPSVPFTDPVYTRRYDFHLDKEGTSWKMTYPIQPLYFY